jgi:glycosyltransferase involved in cell wall biosynthesis
VPLRERFRGVPPLACVMSPKRTRAPHRVAFLGNHLPRECGIATFTTDLTSAMAKEYPKLDCFVLAMNDTVPPRAYPPRVRFELGADDPQAYLRAADFLNVNNVDLLSLQHEYGIFGGKAGGHLLTTLRELRMPIVTTLHTILSEPNEHQRAVMQEITALSERLVVMSEDGAELLRRVHGVSDAKIDFIPHGIPDLPPAGASKDRLGLKGRSVILTFGLISRDKGIEYVIQALPEIARRFPNAVYLVLGATHPHVREHDGESYRLSLEILANELRVDENVIFHNRFVSDEELTEFLAAADICVTPYLQPDQITSGALAYAVGAGKAVISTPYRYATELLAGGKGLLVPMRDPKALATAIMGLLGSDTKRVALGKKAGAGGAKMRWPAVAERYMESFAEARSAHAERKRVTFVAKTLAARPAGLPDMNVAQLRLLTDDTGILQHARYSVPRYEDGYCLDDNARALMATTLMEEEGAPGVAAIRGLSARYLAFVSHAFDEKAGRFRNFMSYSRAWTESLGSEDSHGRALWALGTAVGRSHSPGTATLAADLFHGALGAAMPMTSPRAWSYTLLGMDEYLKAFAGDRGVERQRTELAKRLLALHQRSSGPGWPWFEERVTYCNARMPQALIVSGARMANKKMITAGLASLEWLVSIQRNREGNFAPIGSNGFFQRGATPAGFDQQPVEASTIVSACFDAYRVSGDAAWNEHARVAFNWFLGQNDLHTPLYDAATGGCRDGLHHDRANENQGAESTVSFLLTLLDMRSAARAGTASISQPKTAA